MKKRTQREKVVAVQEKMLESVKGGSRYSITTGYAADPDAPKDTIDGGG
ncbi:MAG TPA: hypothetical protein VIJ02_13500 [Thermoanaerobaculia bacterium]